VFFAYPNTAGKKIQRAVINALYAKNDLAFLAEHLAQATMPAWLPPYRFILSTAFQRVCCNLRAETGLKIGKSY